MAPARSCAHNTIIISRRAFLSPATLLGIGKWPTLCLAQFSAQRSKVSSLTSLCPQFNSVMKGCVYAPLGGKVFLSQPKTRRLRPPHRLTANGESAINCRACCMRDRPICAEPTFSIRESIFGSPCNRLEPKQRLSSDSRPVICRFETLWLHGTVGRAHRQCTNCALSFLSLAGVIFSKGLRQQDRQPFHPRYQHLLLILLGDVFFKIFEIHHPHGDVLKFDIFHK